MLYRHEFEMGTKQQQPTFTKPHSFIGSTGTVMHFCDYTIPGTDQRVLCIILNLQTIKFLKEHLETHPTLLPQQNTDIHAKLLSTMQKHKEERTTPTSSTPTKMLGKRPA